MRRKDREVTDITQIQEILNHAVHMHLGINDDGYPYIVPMHYGYEYIDDTFVFYMHGAKQGHKKDLITQDPRVFVQIDTDIEMVPGDIACDYSSCYASFMGKGIIEVIEDDEEKKYGLNVLMKQQTGNEFEFNPYMVAAVDVYRVVVKEFSAKRKAKK